MAAQVPDNSKAKNRREGIIKTAVSKSAGGILMRRLLPAALLVPPFLYWLCLQGQYNGLYGPEFRIIFFSILNVAIFSFVIWRSAVAMNNLEGERKETGQSLSRLVAIVEFSDDAIIGKTLDGIITSWNKGAERIFLYSADEMIGKEMRALSPPERMDEETEILRKVSRGENIDHFETVRVRKDGTRIYVSTTVSPIKDSAGAIIGASNITRDITGRKQAEEDLRKAENRYKSTLDSMMEGSQIIGFDFRYLYLNDIAAVQGRMKKESLLGRTMMEVYPGIENTEMFAHLAACMKNRTPHHMENEFAFPDGTSNWFKLSMEPVPEGVFILSADITKEKQLAEEIKQHRDHLEELVRERTTQLETANKELEAFSYSVSHDLRAPLRHIDGFADLLNKHARESLDEQSRRYLAIISESAKHMGVLIDELLVFSRMGRVEMRTVKLALEPLVKEIIAEMGNDIQGRAVEWEIDPLPEIQGDPSMLRLVLQNLIGNAVKYTRQRDKAVIHIGSKKENKEIVFFIQDNGVGFDMQYVDKLFGVFQRLHRSEDFEGTGVGLANVRRIIERHGGRTWAVGEIDKGATFYFSLPALLL